MLLLRVRYSKNIQSLRYLVASSEMKMSLPTLVFAYSLRICIFVGLVEKSMSLSLIAHVSTALVPALASIKS